MSKVLFKHAGQTAETFFTAHNVFAGKQYDDAVFMNSGRWIEGGIRYKF